MSLTMITVSCCTLTAFILAMLHSCQSVPTRMDPLTGRQLQRDPDFPEYWQLPQELLEPDEPVESMAATAPVTETLRPPNNTISPFVSQMQHRVTAASQGAVGVRCQRQKERRLIDYLGRAKTEALRPFTPVSFCASDRRQRKQLAPQGNRTPEGARGRYNYPTGCGEKIIGRNTQCPYKLTCSYNSTRYPPLMYSVTCLQHDPLYARSGSPMSSWFSCRTCSIMTQWVWVLSLVETSGCMPDNKEIWVPKLVRAQRACGCRVPHVSPMATT